MSPRLSIRPAHIEELDELARLRTECIRAAGRDGYSRAQLDHWAAINPVQEQRERVLDGCVLLGTARGRIAATVGLDLDAQEMVGLYVHPALQGRGLGRRMVVAIEQLAVRFGMSRIRSESAAPTIGFHEACGYRRQPGERLNPDPRTGLDSLTMWRTFPRRQTRYGAQVQRINDALGIPRNYGRIHRLMLQEECRELASVGQDAHGRERHLVPEAADAWHAMRIAALHDAVELEVASAFRTVEYQAGIIEHKLMKGQKMNRILAASAAPGYSEHHTGRAIDITTPGSAPFEEVFEQSAAFEWLIANGDRFGFRLSYPRGNRHGILYEPWHWYYRR
jgi:D-alanyl-D-alanine carboxypeptidase